MSGDPPQTRGSVGALTPTDQLTIIHDLNDKVTADCRRPAESVVFYVVDQDARAAVFPRLERAWTTLARGGRLDLVAGDLAWAADRLTVVVDRQLATAERVLDRPVEPWVLSA